MPVTTDSVRSRLALLENLRVVLVETKFSGNLGMVARAMKNTGLSDLRLVKPRAEVNKEAYTRAVAGADLLDTARFHDRLSEAVADCGLVIGYTRRKGAERRNVLTPEAAADMARAAVEVNKIGMVFGSEDNGLSTEDLSLCHWISSMVTGSGTESFNLAHAVAINAYLLNRAVVAGNPPPRKLASSKNLENMYGGITQFLIETGFIHETDPKRIVAAVRQIMHRSGLNEREVRIVRGILRQARWRIENPDAPLEPRDVPKRKKP